MKSRLTTRKIIILLTFVLIILGGVFWYKEQITNKEAPKRAYFVDNNLRGLRLYG